MSWKDLGHGQLAEQLLGDQWGVQVEDVVDPPCHQVHSCDIHSICTVARMEHQPAFGQTAQGR